MAAKALEESRTEVEALLSRYSGVIVIGTGGKGTGAGTMFPVVQMARAQRKLVIPIFVRPSFERHEVDKRRYDHALGVVERFDSAKIRLIEILNDQGYADTDPQPQSVVWERMNRPIARGLRGLLYVLSDLSQVDPSDLSMLFAGSGRLRMGFAEIDPPDGHDPSEEQVADAVRTCWQNTYYSFSKPVGTSLVCIQGDWSNVVDAGIKGGLATHGHRRRSGEHLHAALCKGRSGTQAMGCDGAVCRGHRRARPTRHRLERLKGYRSASRRRPFTPAMLDVRQPIDQSCAGQCRLPST